MTHDESVELTKHPGKFEGEPGYVPWYWDMANDSGADRTVYDEETPVDIFDICLEDLRVWPELNGYDRLYLWEDGQGFVNSALE